MTKLRWDKVPSRKRDLVSAARHDLPWTGAARYHGTCCLCERPWKPGDPIVSHDLAIKRVFVHSSCKETHQR